MKDLGFISKILDNIHVITQTDDNIKINQNHYIHQVLVGFWMEHSKPAPVPLSSTINIESQDTQLLDRQDYEAYRHLIEKLIFIATGTRILISPSPFIIHLNISTNLERSTCKPLSIFSVIWPALLFSAFYTEPPPETSLYTRMQPTQMPESSSLLPALCLNRERPCHLD